MNIHYHKNFLKHFKLRVEPNPDLDKRFHDRLQLFLKNSHSPILKNHTLVGNKAGYRAFSVSGDIRVVYKPVEDGILLYDVGTHNQVY